MKRILTIVLSLLYANTAWAAAGESIAPVAEASPIAQVTVAAASVPTAIGTPQFANTAPLCDSFVQNGTNVDIDVALNGAAANTHRVPAGAEWYSNWCAKRQKMSGAIQINIPASAATPSSGSIVIGGSSR